RIPHRALVFLISDFITPPAADVKSQRSDAASGAFPWENALRAAAAKHDVVAVHVMDPRELKLPNVGRVTLEDPETRRQIIVNTSLPDVRRSYEEHMAQMQE